MDVTAVRHPQSPPSHRSTTRVQTEPTRRRPPWVVPVVVESRPTPALGRDPRRTGAASDARQYVDQAPVPAAGPGFVAPFPG